MPKLKKWNIFVYILIFFGISLAGRITNLVTDYYWFVETGFDAVFRKMFLAQIGMGIAGALVMWGALALNFLSARRISRKPFILIEPESAFAAPMPEMTEFKPVLMALLTGAMVLAGFFAGQWSAGHAETLLKFAHAGSFGVNDPLFNLDVGFYVFKLPFYRYLYHLALAALIVSAIVSVAIYAVNARFYVTERGVRMADDTRSHLAALAGVLALLVAVHFQLKIFDMLSVQKALAPGAGFADVHAYLPGLKVLRFVALAAAVMLWLSPWFASVKLIVGAVVLLVAGTLLSRVYSEIVQKFEVSPNEVVKETPYLKLAIENTRRAYGLTDVQDLEFDPQENLTVQSIRQNDLTIENIRLWEHRPLLTTYGQLQEIRTYYDFLDADNDRYWIDGKYRQVMLSVRELVPESLPSRIWINEHLTYTHGYGLCMGPVNRISREGLPEFFVKDIPPTSTTEIVVTRPEIYFGESPATYAIVNTESKEFDYPSGDENVYTRYNGTGGVPAGGFLKRSLFAARFGELKIIFSSDISPESRFLYNRPIRERASLAAPFLKFDPDPYIVINKEGKLFWMLDAYTTTDRYPYSERNSGINYIRNSVKVTIDAYNGTIAFYISDPADPIVNTYASIFPGMFKSMDSMPEDLRSHIRYPQTMMNIQARVYATYHMTEPQVFYNKEDLWKIPFRSSGGQTETVEPYYTIMKLAGVGEREEFILMAPFTPAKKENMIAWMAARCDPPNYGRLLVYNFPKHKLVYGTQQIESRIDQDAEISKQLTLWDQGGSRVLRGSMLVIPVDRSLLYVQPLYLEASGGGLPELKRVIVSYGNSIAMEENLELCLSRIFGGQFSQAARAAGRPDAAPTDDLKMLSRQAREYFDKAQRAARSGDWTAYGSELKSLEQTLKKMNDVK